VRGSLAVRRNRRARPAGTSLHDRHPRHRAPQRGQSTRSAQVLRLLANKLRRCGGNDYVRDFLPALDAALARQPGPA
ncbi:MAG: hypothetical protein ACRDTT_03875, partial [Pseudonocardiaceae bacterium]